MDENTRNEILQSISLTGAADNTTVNVHVGIGTKTQAESLLIARNGGLAKFKDYQAKGFSLILSQPLTLAILNNLNIRCCLCGKVITYPAWYKVMRYVVNQFHFFVCFDPDSPSKPTARCYRR